MAMVEAFATAGAIFAERLMQALEAGLRRWRTRTHPAGLNRRPTDLAPCGWDRLGQTPSACYARPGTSMHRR